MGVHTCIYGSETFCFTRSNHIPKDLPGVLTHTSKQQKASKGAPGPALERTEGVMPCPQGEGQRCPLPGEALLFPERTEEMQRGLFFFPLLRADQIFAMPQGCS